MARRAPIGVVFTSRTRKSTAHPVRRRCAVHAMHAAKANNNPSPYGRTTTEYSYAIQ